MNRIGLAIAVLTLATPAAAIAQESEIGFSGKVGSLGLGAELSIPLSQTMAFRAGLNGFSYDRQDRISDIDYDFALDLRSASLLLDWYPADGGFRLGGGVLYNGNGARAVARPVDSYQIGDYSFSSSEVGRLTADVGFDEYSPYVGLGWDYHFGLQSRVGLSLEFGVLFHGEPRVTLSADGDLAGDPLFETELARERMDLEADVSDYRYYPVGSIGLTYRF